MRCIFFLITAIGWQLFSAAEIYAQPQIDSVHVEMKDIFVNKDVHDNGGGGGPQSAYDTYDSSLMNLSRTYLFSNASGVADSFLLDGHGSMYLVFDSITNVVDTFNYFVLGNSDEESFAFSKGELGEDLNKLEISLDQDALISSRFYYLKSDQYNYSGGGIHRSSTHFRRTVPTSYFTVTFYKHATISLVGANSTANNDFTINPNPTNKKISISLPKDQISELEVRVFDVLGKEVSIIHISHSTFPLDLDVSSLPPGIYYLRAGNQMEKFVIQR